MTIKINKKKIFIYLFSLLVVLPYFGSNIGISFGEIKINIADIIIFMYTIRIILKKNTYKKLKENATEIIEWRLLLLLFIFFIPLGMLNDASLGEQIRQVRNVLYIIITYYILIDNGENINVIFLIEYISIISAFDCIIRTFILHSNANWYQFYRANGVLNVFLFSFLILRIWTMNKKEALLGVLCCIGLIYSSFLSQERTQLLTIGIAIVIALVYQINLKLRSLNNLRIKTKVITRGIIFVILASIIVYYVLQNDFVKKYIDYYVTYRLSNGNLLKGNGILQRDGSFSARKLQFNTIFKENKNLFYILFGKGTCAHYIAAQGDTYIVDSAILWIYKDLGIVGTILIIKIFMNMLKKCQNIKNSSKLSIYISGISLIIFSIYNPSFIYTSSAAFAFGLYFFLKYKSIRNNE